MKRKPVLFLLAFITMISAAVSFEAVSMAAGSAKGGKINCVEIEQRQRTVGRVRLLIGDIGGKVETTHYSLLLPTPGNIVHLMNDQTHRYVTFTLPQWRKKFNFYVDSRSGRGDRRQTDAEFTDYSQFKKVGTGIVAGMKSMQYSRFRTNNKPPPRDKLYVEDVWFSHDVSIPTHVLETYKRTLNFNFDQKLGLPLKMKETRTWFNKKRKTEEISYETLACRKIQVPKEEFVVPKSYKKVKDEMAVLMDDVEGDDINMFGDQTGKDSMLGPEGR